MVPMSVFGSCIDDDRSRKSSSCQVAANGPRLIVVFPRCSYDCFQRRHEAPRLVGMSAGINRGASWRRYACLWRVAIAIVERLSCCWLAGCSQRARAISCSYQSQIASRVSSNARLQNQAFESINNAAPLEAIID